MQITIEQATKLLGNGHVIAVPTDTVYGLAASLIHLDAIEEIFSLKGRSIKNPMIIQASHVEELSPFIKEYPPHFDKLAHKFWPGPLTLIVQANTSKVPEMVRTGLPTIGLRIPNHKELLELLKQTGPLVITSANLSGEPSSKTFLEVELTFSPNFPVLESSTPTIGLESTIMIYENKKWKVIRNGAIETSKLEHFVQELETRS